MISQNVYFILISGVLIHLCSSISSNDFYPSYTRLLKNDDGNSNEIAITTTLPFFDKHFNSLYVNTNGVISFNVPVRQFTPDRFPLGDGRVMIAPFWADVDISSRGNITYTAFTNPVQLKNATDDVRKHFPHFRRFSATWLFVTTWYKVPYYGSTSENDPTNTFQSIIITNGRYSFVRFNYHEITWTSGTHGQSGGNSNGLGGVEPECGFNAGDGSNSYSITKPGSISALDLPKTTNVNTTGVWMFRIDNAEIKEAGCSKSGYLTFSSDDYTVVMFGGRNINVFGPCLNKTDKFICKFDGGKTSPGAYLSTKTAVRCTPPMVDFIGKANLSLSRDNGKTFPYNGIFFYVSPEEIKTPRLKTCWKNSSTLNIRWTGHVLNSLRVKINVQIARFVWKEDAVKFHSFYNISENNRENEEVTKGHSENVVLYKKEVVGDRERFASFVRVIKRVLYETQAVSTHEWLWSKAVKWNHTSEESSLLCKQWALKQPNPEILKDDQLLACPPTKEKADADSGRYRKTNDYFPSYGTKSDEIHCNIPRNLRKKDERSCYITITPSLKNFGQSCCYNNNNNNVSYLLVGYKDNGGTLQRVHHEADYPYVTHYFQDVLPYYHCCYWSTSACEMAYYAKRPGDNGKNYTAPLPAALFGDPHMITLDGVQYTFNGYGEYIVLKISNDEFMLQGRMEQLRPINRTSINATVYTAFAMKALESDAIQIELSHLDIEVTVNGGERYFDSDGMIRFSNGFIKRKPNTTKYSVIFRNGIRVTVEKETLLLQLMVNLPDKFLGKTSGLLGFFDNNKENEFLLPNGTFLKTSSDAKTLHYDFGLKWIVDANESLFNYYGNRNHSYFHRDNFVPLFFDYENLTFNDANLEAEARRVCQGDVQCLVDAIATGQPSFGMFSRNIINEYKRTLSLNMKIDCTPLSPEFDNGLMLRNDTSEGEIQYTFKCNTNFALNGASEISCKNGIWNGTKPSCKDCTPLSPQFDNGLMLRNDSNEGEIHYTFKCYANYVLNGTSAISCKNGIWNGTKPSCKGVKVKKIKIQINNYSNSRMKLTKIMAISTACGAVLIAVVVVTVCYIRRNRRREIFNVNVEKCMKKQTQNKKEVIREDNQVETISSLDSPIDAGVTKE